ncbi:HNH endonuclease [Clostridium butyricum]|uniref:HNH endonuclease n=1 Tax=Clostridium butyricum TaxID=1492 RepID=UPI00374E3434
MSKHIAYSDINYINIIKGETDWKKAALQPIKDDIRDYLYQINDNKCYFCKSKIDNATNNETIEHIISKDKCPNFTFKPENLTMACSDCNRIKNDDDVLNSSITNPENLDFYNYPSQSNDYIIVHPYFDEYSDHIDIDDIFYLGKDDKGKTTIRYYNLTRLALAEKKIKEKRGKKKLTSVVKDMLAKHKYNIKEIDNVFVSGNLMKYINYKINSKSKWSEECINSINSLDYSQTHIFKIFKSLSKCYYNYNNTEIDNSEFIKLSDLKKAINVVDKLLNMLHEIVLHVDDRRQIYTFRNVKFNEIEFFFKEYINQIGLNIQLEVLFHFKNLMNLIETYDFNYENKDIKIQVDTELRILKDIKAKYVNEQETNNAG